MQEAKMRLPEPEAERTEDVTLALARAEAELLRITVEMARVQTVPPSEPPTVHDLSPLGQRLLAR